MHRLLVDEGLLQRSGCAALPKPSSVVTARASTAQTGVTQERIACAVEVHGAGAALATPQPNFGPFSSSASRSTYSSGVSGSASTARRRPLTSSS